MGAPVKIGVGTRIKAFLCRLCPICIPARWRPDSAYARRIRVIQNACPFCAAWIRVQRFKAAETAPTQAAAAI